MKNDTSNSNDVSVVMPTWNGSRFLRQSLESILQQTLPPAEIVVCDDCSTDDTLDIVNAVQRTTSIPFQIHKLSRNSGGPAKPLNVAIKAAKCNIIAVLEQDDRMSPDRLELQRCSLRTHVDARISIGRYAIIMENGQPIPDRLHPDHQFDGLRMKIPDRQEARSFEVPSHIAIPGLVEFNFAISNSNFTFLKDLWLRVGGFDERIKGITDLDFFLKCLLQSNLAIANGDVLEFHLHGDSLLHHDLDRSRNESLAILEKFILRHPRMVRMTSFWPAYWRTRENAVADLRRGHLLSAARTYWRLLVGGALIHHLRNRKSMVAASGSD